MSRQPTSRPCSTWRRPNGLHTLEGHAGFAADVLKVKSNLLTFLISAAAEGKTVAGEPSAQVKAVLGMEEANGLHTLEGHAGFAADVLRIKSDLLTFLISAAAEGKTVAGYGAPGKGNTLLNHCGIRSRPTGVHGRPVALQAGHVPAGNAHPDLRAGQAHRD